MEKLKSIEIKLDSFQEGLVLHILERKPNTLHDCADASEYNEARYQLVEGHFYDFEFSNEKFSFERSQIVHPHLSKKHVGTIAPNIYVGTISLQVILDDEEFDRIELEVQSIKTDYRYDYRDMLKYITEQCTELLMQANSPISQSFEIDFNESYNTLYQKFTFIYSILSTEEFKESLYRIISFPVTQWTETNELSDIRRIKRFGSKQLREIGYRTNRTSLPKKSSVSFPGLTSLPIKITTVQKTDSLDTPENRFVKNSLQVFLAFCQNINELAEEGTKLQKESFSLVKLLETNLQHNFFKDISKPTTLKINSPILQRKEGYREILRVWLMFELAGKLTWEGGENVYSGGKKDIASLYEYWLFFKLLEIIGSVFKIKPDTVNELIEKADHGLHLRLKQGTHSALQGVYSAGSRKLKIRFNYNRSFSGSKNYPFIGSWTSTMRPDFTLSIWPAEISDYEAEMQELIMHIHFDAKYKISNLSELLVDKESTEHLNEEKIENRQGVYKNADLLKMHAYKDAIRRTVGAYILYPGDEELTQKGFHEIIPGLGAFPIKPRKDDTGEGALKAFLNSILKHFLNRASQREKLAYRIYDIHKVKESNVLYDLIPETVGKNRDLIPDETHVLIGYYKSEEHYKWITERKYYNFRIGTGAGSLILDKKTVNSKYLLLHTKGDKSTIDLWRIKSKGPRVFSKKDMLHKGYPSLPKDYYLVIEIEPLENDEFNNYRWDIRKLKNYRQGRGSAIPFTASLTELMEVRIR